MPTAEQELTEYLDDLCAPAAEERERWQITDDGAADWAIRHIREAERAQEQREQTAREECEKIMAWARETRERTDRDTAFLRAHLESYMRNKAQANPKCKSYVLPSGTLQLRKPAAKWIYAAEGEVAQALGDYAHAHRCIRVTAKADGELAFDLLEYAEHNSVSTCWELDKAKLKKACQPTPDGRVVDENGEVVPGVVVEEQMPEFVLKF